MLCLSTITIAHTVCTIQHFTILYTMYTQDEAGNWKYPDPRTGEPINFNMLPTYAAGGLGVMPHTVQVRMLCTHTWMFMYHA